MSIESIFEKYYQLKYAFFYKGKSGVYEELKDYTFMTKSDMDYVYAGRKGNRNKGLKIGQKLKSVLRKVGVNGLFMRMASVLKQNKYREK